MAKSNIQTYQRKMINSQGATSVAGKKFHFIGAGGIGMSGLAQLLMKNNAIVAGSDQCQATL